MILAACGGRGNGEKDAEGLARAESGEGSGRWGGWTGRKGLMGRGGWQQRGGGGQGGGGDREGESGRGQRGGRDGEGSNRDRKRLAMERGTR